MLGRGLRLWQRSVGYKSFHYKLQMAKKIVLVDMDGVLSDFDSAVKQLDQEDKKAYEGQYDNVHGLFKWMEPMPDAIESFKKLFYDGRFDVYIVTSSPWSNYSAASDKIQWVQDYIEPVVPEIRKRVIISSHKNLCQGAYIIDDRLRNGVAEFQGHHLHFGSEAIPDWKAVLKFFGIE